MSSASAEANELRDKEIALQQRTLPGVLTQGTAGIDNYPAKFFNSHPVEQKIGAWREASLLADAAGLGKPSFEKELYDFAESKKREQNLLNFERFVEKRFDVRDPSQLRIMQEIYPEWQSKREAAIVEAYELGKQVELIKLRGLKSKDDLIFAFAAANNDMKIPTLNWDDANVIQTDAEIKRGLLNPYRWASKTVNNGIDHMGRFWGKGGDDHSSVDPNSEARKGANIADLWKLL